MKEPVDFDNGDIVSYAGDEYLVLLNYGHKGIVFSLNDRIVVNDFRWRFDGETAMFVRKCRTAVGGILPPGLWKYVTFADGYVDFCDACDYGKTHNSIVYNNPGKTPVSAGTIKVTKELRWVIKEGGSVSAKLPRGGNDEDVIANAVPGMTHDNELIYSW